MKEKWIEYKEKINQMWSNRTRRQKIILVSSVGLIVILISALLFFMLHTKYSPLYHNLTMEEVHQIQEELDERDIPYEITDGGTAISVPEEHVDRLLVELAGKGIPKSGGIDYSFFSENASWGVTDNEFDMMKLDAMQTELANLIKGIEGVQDASVLINLPEDSIYIADSEDEASASIVLHTEIGHEFEENQIESLYHLVSKAVPNLPEENIVIRNQYLEYFDIASSNKYQDDYSQQQAIKKDIEQDIQRRLQHMIGSMVGMEKVIVSVTADIDFTEENRIEELVEPVDLENMEGLPVSIETIQETYSGDDAQGGIPGTGDEDIPDYPAEENGESGDYELIKETINNEFNQIRREIVESPYKIRDLGIQVAVDNVRNVEEDEVEYLSPQDQNSVEEGITSILNSMIMTSVDEEYEDIEPEDRISIVFQEFSHDDPLQETPDQAIPLWMYILGACLLLLIIVLTILLIRTRRKTEEEFVEEIPVIEQDAEETPEVDETVESETMKHRKQLEKMAKEKPEDFVKLLRSWIIDD